MKVAIIGAGVAGLACAHELERHGITPTIFEIKDYIGDAASHVGVILEIYNRPVRNAVQYLQKEFAISLIPLNQVRSITHHSPNRTTVIKGDLGAFFIRGREQDSVMAQLSSQLRNTEVRFHEDANYKELLKQNDYVVIADGKPFATKELGCWNEQVSGWVKGAVVLGDFDPHELIIWLNNDYTQKGYAYLAPFNNKKASLVLFVPYINANEITHYWEKFVDLENMSYPIVQDFEYQHFSGFANPHKTGNIYFAGIAGGALDSFLGFGLLTSILQGVFAAQSIAQGKDYEKLLHSVVKRNKSLYELRRAFDNATNADFDKILSLIGLPGIRQLTYKSPLNVIQAGSALLRWARGQVGE
ncbi:MAG: NAD(P)/FAD-dependent oxidoreductase [Acidobacteriota bacterium]